MITPQEATEKILAHTPLSPAIALAADARGTPLSAFPWQILRQSVLTDRAYPPFHRVMMDGIALDHRAYLRGQRQFIVAGVQAAGTPAAALNTPHECIEVMTGAVLPQNCDTVIPYEDVDMNHGHALVADGLMVEAMANIHPQGVDARAHQILFHAGHRLQGADWSLMGAVGCTNPLVAKRPAIALISTGDELVDANQVPLPHQIRASNHLSLMIDLQSRGFQHLGHHQLIDDPRILANQLTTLLDDNQYLIISGGVSKGKFDYIPQVLKNLGVKEIFHKVTQKPGKPLWFGIGPREQLVFGLPGNPMSTLITYRRYVIPSLIHHLGGDKSESCVGRLSRDLAIKLHPQFTLFQPVIRLWDSDGIVTLDPLRHHGSGDLASLKGSDGFVECSPSQQPPRQGQIFEFFPWQSL